MKALLAVLLASACSAALAQTSRSIATHHYDYGRTGWNPTETILTPSAVRSSQFGLIATVPL